MRVLVDTNIWIDHFHKAEPELNELLAERKVLGHPFVRGELALGNLKHRELVLEFMAMLPRSAEADLEDSLLFVEKRGYNGRGVGLLDVMILASVLITPGTRLWTRDRRLAVMADECEVAFKEKTDVC